MTNTTSRTLNFYCLALANNTLVAQVAPETSALKQALHQSLDVPWRDHCLGLVRHRRCASGHVLVGWIVQRYPAPRSAAVQWAAQLMRQGALHHVFDDQPFRADGGLYRLG